MSLAPRLRQMVGVDPDEWSDEQLDDVLLRHRRVVQAQISVIAETPTLRGLADVAGTIDPDDDATIVPYRGADPIPFALEGDVVTFEDDVAGYSQLVWTGFTYDLHAAAADVLEAWASTVALDVDVSTDGQSVKRSQKVAALKDAADRHRRRALVGSVELP